MRECVRWVEHRSCTKEPSRKISSSGVQQNQMEIHSCKHTSHALQWIIDARVILPVEIARTQPKNGWTKTAGKTNGSLRQRKRTAERKYPGFSRESHGQLSTCRYLGDDPYVTGQFYKYFSLRNVPFSIVYLLMHIPQSKHTESCRVRGTTHLEFHGRKQLRKLLSHLRHACVVRVVVACANATGEYLSSFDAHTMDNGLCLKGYIRNWLLLFDMPFSKVCQPYAMQILECAGE